MAQITWMNVPIPDIGGTQQQGIRTAADLLNNATRSASAGVAGLQAIQDAKQAAQVQAADRFALENMLSTQDPNKFNQMKADGSLLGPAADRVSSATLMAMDQRSNQLYNLDRERAAHREMSDAVRYFDEAAKVATDDPDRAQEIMSQARFTDASRASALAQDVRKLYVDPDKAGAERKKKEERLREAYGHVDNILGMGKENPEGAARYIDSIPDPLVRGETVDRLLQLKYPVVDNVYGAERSQNLTSTGTPTIVEGTDRAMSRQFGPNEKFAAQAVAQGNYFPGSPEWQQKTGRAPTMGDVHDWQEKYVKPFSAEERKREGKEPTTALGPYQVTNSTRREFVEKYGDSLFGTSDMSAVPFTPENEEKLAKKVFEVQGYKAWEATKKLKDPSFLKGKAWEDARPLLSYIDGGVAPESFAPQVKQLEAKLQERELSLGEGAKVIRNARPNESWGLNQAAEDLVKSFGKDTRPGEARELVEKTVRKAREAGTVITYAEASELIKNSVRDDGNLISTGIFSGKIPTVSDLNDDLDLEESKLVQSAKDLGNARADLKSHERRQDDLKSVQELSLKYKDDMAAAKKALALAKEKPGAGESALNTFKRWQETSNQLAKKLAAGLRADVSSTRGTGKKTPLDTEGERQGPENTLEKLPGYVVPPTHLDLMLGAGGNPAPGQPGRDEPYIPSYSWGSNQFNTR